MLIVLNDISKKDTLKEDKIFDRNYGENVNQFDTTVK